MLDELSARHARSLHKLDVLCILANDLGRNCDPAQPGRSPGESSYVTTFKHPATMEGEREA